MTEFVITEFDCICRPFPCQNRFCDLEQISGSLPVIFPGIPEWILKKDDIIFIVFNINFEF